MAGLFFFLFAVQVAAADSITFKALRFTLGGIAANQKIYVHNKCKEHTTVYRTEMGLKGKRAYQVIRMAKWVQCEILKA